MNKIYLLLSQIPIQFKKDLFENSDVIKGSLLLVLLSDFAGFWDNLIGNFYFDIGVITVTVGLVFADVIAGAYKALKKGEFDGKKLGDGIFYKIMKYGGVIIVLVLLMNATYRGNPIPILDKFAFLFYVAIISIELDSISGHFFGKKFSQMLNKAVETIGVFKTTVKSLKENK